MDMRFCMWNVRSLNRTGLLMTAVKEISICKLHFSGGYRGSDVTEVALNQQVNIHFSMER
jgi:hypothetical protein